MSYVNVNPDTAVALCREANVELVEVVADQPDMYVRVLLWCP
ncbi:hypothetical protein [Streptococcus danieliae]|nr:hypothetical protein [Streptococcus danieliae]